jgi:Fe-S-cluster formation regulator IscX/YfhJ
MTVTKEEMIKFKALCDEFPRVNPQTVLLLQMKDRIERMLSIMEAKDREVIVDDTKKVNSSNRLDNTKKQR